EQSVYFCLFYFFFSSRRRHTRSYGDWSSDVCSSDLSFKTNRPPISPWPRSGRKSPAQSPSCARSWAETIRSSSTTNGCKPASGQIGRASCRERVEKTEGVGTEKKKENKKSGMRYK